MRSALQFMFNDCSRQACRPGSSADGGCEAHTGIRLSQTVDKFAEAARKVSYQKKSPGGFFVGAMMAGTYVGLSIILIFTLGNDVDPSIRKLVMGACFGISLTLVIFAGSELFTGYTMYMATGWLRGRVLPDSIRMCAIVWLGTALGALLVTSLFVVSSGGNLVDGTVLYVVRTG